jgi:hypothetical protein
MLIRLEALGLCHHRRNVIPQGIRPQPSALNYAQDEPVVGQSDWVMVFDADEFLSIKYGDGTLDDLIAAAKAQNATGIVVTWRIFGSGGVVDWSRAPVTEQYLMAAPPTWNKGWGVKTLFTFHPDYWKLGIHRPKMKTRHIKTEFPNQVKWLNGSGREMEDYFKFRGWRSITRTVGYDWVQLNHYAVKSVDSYAIRKMRGNVNNKANKYNSDYWSLQDRNEVRDETMLRYSAVRNRTMSQLLTDPTLRRLHDAAVERAETRLAELKQTDAYRSLVASLSTASAVPISQIVAKPPQARDKEKIAALMSDVEKQRGAKAKADRKAGPKEPPAEAVPVGSYNPGPIDLSSDMQLEVFANHSMKLPLDHRVFAAHVLPHIQSGKFERGLARKMPLVLDKQARVLEIGSAVGFLSGHCANIRTDIHFTLHEDHPGLRQMMLAVCAMSNRAFNDRFVLSDQKLQDLVPDLNSLILKTNPTSLLLADARLAPEVLSKVFSGGPAVRPRQIFLYGRLLEAWYSQLSEIQLLLESLGYQAEESFDPNICRTFRLQPDLASLRSGDLK